MEKAIRFNDIKEGFDFVNFDSGWDNHAYLDRTTGEIYLKSDYDLDSDELPNGIDIETLIELPHRKDLGLGKNLAFGFADSNLPDAVDTLVSIFGKRGAYSRFKELLEAKGLLDLWYEFETREEEKALREWCEDNDIEIEEGEQSAASVR